MVLVPALVVGLLLGWVLQRGDFCMHSALRELLDRRPAASLRAYLLALAAQLAAVNSLATFGWLTPAYPVVAPVASVLGGSAFGVGMVLAKG